MDKKQRRAVLVEAAITAVAVLLIALYLWRKDHADQEAIAPAPVLAVATTRAQLYMLPRRIRGGGGHIAPWQEASVGTEAEGLQLTEVHVNVGDKVRRGQVLAVFKSEMVTADLALASLDFVRVR